MLLALAVFKDATTFAVDLFRDDIHELNQDDQVGDNSGNDYTMTEEQFEVLETFCREEMKKSYKPSSFSNVEPGVVKTKDLVMSFRKRLDITKAIN